MGNEASKSPVVEPPPEWDPTSNAKQFELVSPMSDLSDPSMFLHRRPHPKLSDATVKEIAGNKRIKPVKDPPAKKAPLGAERRGSAAARQTPAGDRRRRSKVIATRDSAYKHEPRPRDLAPPSAFYFPDVPTRETEEKLNRMSVRQSSSTGARRQSNATTDKGKKVDQQNKENNTPLLQKARRKVNRARTCFTGCFEESGHNIQLIKDNVNPQVKRGERLSSEAGTEKGATLLKANEQPPVFDPYQQDPLPKAKKTVLQLIDGAEQELSFNPVWRESHDGTYHSDPSSTGAGRRSSDFTLQKRGSTVTSRRASDPPSQPSRSRPTSTKDTAMNDQVPHPPGDVLERFKEENRASLATKDSSNARESVETANTNKESSASVATSHESSYWNGFYKEAQVLHQEDAYFDRISFDHSKAKMAEPSPMANNSSATPFAASSGQNKQKSLLGSMDASDAGCEEKLGLAKTIADEATSSSELPSLNRLSQGSKNSVGAPLDEQSKSSPRRASLSTVKATKENQLSLNKPNDVMPLDEKADHSSAKVNSLVLIKKQPADEDFGFEKEDKENLSNDHTSRHSFLDRRITADKVLVQTSLVRRMPKSCASMSEGEDIKAALQATPQNSVLERRASFGSTFSYKDKDVFTPVTSLTTYPKGSPFRPRLAVAEKAMAKANLDKPVTFTQSFDNTSRCSRDLEIQAADSAPSMIESHDYRDIALGCFEDARSTASSKKENALALFSPGIMSIESPMSTVMSPTQPLLSNQVVNNAAFLFSPSYAGGQVLESAPSNAGSVAASQRTEESGKIDLKSRDRSFSISTLGSRSRLSGRSKKSIRIPFSSSGSTGRLAIKNTSTKDSITDDGSSQKTVRFSDSHSVAVSAAPSQKSRRSVTWDFSFKDAPDNVDIPAIETKVSDLSEPAFERDSLLADPRAKRESTDSVKSSLREAHSTIEEETASLTVSDAGSRQSLSSSRVSQCDSTGRPSEGSDSRQSVSSGVSEQSSFSVAGTPEQATRTWTYCEFTKGVTPMLDKRQLAQATNSPVLRFKAAKNKFIGKQEKEVPVKTNCPTFCKRKAGTGRVHLLASKFDNGRPAPEPMALNSSSRNFGAVDRPNATAGSGVVPGERPMLRTPQIVGYTAKAHPDIYSKASFGSQSTSQSIKPATTAFQLFPARTMSTDASINTKSEAPFDETPEEVSDDDSSQHTAASDDSTFVQSVATLRQDRHTVGSVAINLVEDDQEQDRLDAVLDEILESHTSTDSQDRQEDVPQDEIEADDFAELLLNNILASTSTDESSVSHAQHGYQSLKKLKSISYDDDDDENSTFTNIQSLPTFSDESTTMSTMLAQQTTANLRYGAQTVKPHVQKVHSSHAFPPTQALNLSPLQRTPMQANKWRELAERAQKQDSNKKSIFRSAGKKSKKKKSGLSERNTNII